MIEYVCGFMYSGFQNKILLVEKEKPEWQRGLLNGIGGKIEESESKWEAMVREFQEETLIETKTDDWKYLGCVKGADYVVYFFANKVTYLPSLTKSINDVGEYVGRYLLSDVIRGDHDIVENLFWILMFMLSPSSSYSTFQVIED